MTIIWCMVPEIWSVTELFEILDCFLPFYPPNNPKIQNLEKMKKPLEISLYNSVPIFMIICYPVPDIWCMTDVIIFYFGPFFSLLQPKNSKFKKKWKKTTTKNWRYHYFTQVCQKSWSTWLENINENITCFLFVLQV